FPNQRRLLPRSFSMERPSSLCIGKARPATARDVDRETLLIMSVLTYSPARVHTHPTGSSDETATAHATAALVYCLLASSDMVHVVYRVSISVEAAPVSSVQVQTAKRP